LTSANPNTDPSLQAALERRILHGLASEWEEAVTGLPADLRAKVTRPQLRLTDATRRLGSWSGGRHEISVSRSFALNHPWAAVRDVLRHETAHQVAEALGAAGEPPHGPTFRNACDLLRINPRATGRYPSLDKVPAAAPEDRILRKVRKLMALAESENRPEAEAALAKAHELIARHNVALIERSGPRRFISLCVGRPALRQRREAYHLAGLLISYYFVRGIWVPIYVLEKGKMGRILEISGTRRNVQMAAYVHDFVSRFIDARWRDYNRGRGLGARRKTDFAVGIIQGFADRLAADRHRMTEAGTLLPVHVADPDLDAYMGHIHPRTRQISHGAARRDPSVMADGERLGRNLVIAEGLPEAQGRGGLLPE
jgi:hypothetical protein